MQLAKGYAAYAPVTVFDIAGPTSILTIYVDAF